MSEMAMFPLGSVLFPHLPLQLRVFEPRYLTMLATLLEAGDPVFGVVLIERGQEVGGGEQRFGVGTVAQVTELGTTPGPAGESLVALVAQGGARFEVLEWLAERPYPRAVTRPLPELVWDDALTPQRDRAEALVRRTLALASEFDEPIWSADVALSDDPATAVWQLAGIAPLGPLDQVRLLRSTSFAELLERLVEATTDAAETFSPPWGDDPDQR